MLTGVVQLKNVNNEDPAKQCKLSFTVDITQKAWLTDLFAMDRGTTFLMTLDEIDNAIIDANMSLRDETDAEMSKRYNKRMHAIIKEVALKKGLEKEDIKKLLRKQLITANLMKKSTAELTSKGYSAAIYYLLHNF